MHDFMYLNNKSNLSHFSYVHCGVEILSMSKHVMNKVFDCANGCDVNIYDQDTYSTHLNHDDVEPTGNIYEEHTY